MYIIYSMRISNFRVCALFPFSSASFLEQGVCEAWDEKHAVIPAYPPADPSGPHDPAP